MRVRLSIICRITLDPYVPSRAYRIVCLYLSPPINPCCPGSAPLVSVAISNWLVSCLRLAPR